MEKKTSQSTTARGRAAEIAALEYLEARDYRLVKQGFRWKRGEIDLIMITPEGGLVFVEVRSSSTNSPFLRASIDWKKQSHLFKTAQMFQIRNLGYRGFGCRFDVIWVEGEKIEHWRNVQIG